MTHPVTVDREFTADLEAKGSRFHAHLIPIDRFDSRLQALRVAHRKASHIVTATRTILDNGTIAERARDDGEPGGTAGMPILKVMIGAGLADAGIAVVRYFGGTKLGTGGLARAYGGAASRVVEVATLRPWVSIATRTFRSDFARVSALEQAIAELNLTVIAREHTEDGTTLTLEGPEGALADARLEEWRT